MGVWLLVLPGRLATLDRLWDFIVPTLIGHIADGTLLFSLLAYGQVRREI